MQLDLSFQVKGVLKPANGGTGAVAFTPGSVIFAGAAGVYAQDNATFFWDGLNKRLGLGTIAPQTRLHVLSVGEIARFQTSAAAGAGNGFVSLYSATARKGYWGYGGADDTFNIINEMNFPVQIVSPVAISLVAGGAERARIDTIGLKVAGDLTVGFGSDPVNYSSGIYANSPGGGTVFWDFRTKDFSGGLRTTWSAHANGNMFIGKLATADASILGLEVRPGLLLVTTNAYANIFYFQGGLAPVGNIQCTVSTTAYNTTSDRRLKENIGPAPSAGAIIDAIDIVSHDWRAGGHVRWGVIAQDLHPLVAEAVTPGDDGDEALEPWMWDRSALVPLLIKEIQELRARVAALEAL